MTDRKLLDDCFLNDGERMRHDDALAILRARIGPVAGTETISLGSALGRCLAESVASPRNVPGFDNAAVDGYAFAHAKHAAGSGALLVTVRVAAGHPPSAALVSHTAARIFTGAVMPAGADTIAMQEDCTTTEARGRIFVTIPNGLKHGANRRKAGEDLKAGAIVATAGMRLRPQDIAAIASTGREAVAVYRRLRVAIVSTGDEIVRPGRDLALGQVYDSNAYLLATLLETTGAETVDAGILPDEEPAVRTALSRLATEHDAVLTTGGASRGEEDHLIASLDSIGKRHLWQLAVKPGRPMCFGQIGDCPVIALPGNPVAAFVCFLLYVRPVLAVMGGGSWPEPTRFAVPAAFTLPSRKTGRREFLRGRLVTDAVGATRVEKFARDGSGLITSLREADGLIEIEEDVEAVEPGDLVRFLPFAGMGILS